MPIIGGMRIGEKVKDHRTRCLLTQEQLAGKANISPRQLVRIERNEVEPRFSTIRKLADALGVEPGKITGGNE